ncbi:MAG: glycerol-3-phosphate dehydrogenase [Rhodospirillales bacterium]|nr:glycerol-3-phosphate dehydrogenase [Rhodospirillales bacterium]
MSEGSLEAPTRHPIQWRDADFYDPDKLDQELRRVFDICHGCRRCFNLCDSFPRLFDLIDDSETGELDSVASSDFSPVVEACTLCDMCFMSKCPYVPPHEFNIDFPHLMLRARAVDAKANGIAMAARQLTKTDRNGKLAAPVAGIANWASKTGNKLTRPAMQAVLGIHAEAALPKFTSKPFTSRGKDAPVVDKDAPAYGRKAVLYATCFTNYNNPDIAVSARAVLARNGVETEVVYPKCCGMPQLEQGDIAAVAATAEDVAAQLKPWIEKGYDIIALVPSCALMLKFEWPLIVPENEEVMALSRATFDITQYIVDIGKTEGMAEGLKPLAGGVSIHISCHSRAQNMGQKGAEMLRLIPDTDIDVIERCSGHGGSWGIMKDNFEVALKIGKPAARKVAEKAAAHIVSECPLARDHILQGVERINDHPAAVSQVQHPIQLLALAYGL